MFKKLGVLFAVMSLCGAETWLDKMKKDWAIINYNENFSQKGSGINIAFLDSAFNGEHNSLKGKIIDTLGTNKLSENPSYAPDSMHGTHVAAIALGGYVPLTDGNMHGIAPNSNFYGVSYVNYAYPFDGSETDIVNFLNGKVEIVNNSWGITFFPNSNQKIEKDPFVFDNKYLKFSSSEITPELVFSIANKDEYKGLKATIDLAREGILQVYSSGNEGQRSPNINASMPTYDASLRAWINVGALDSEYIEKQVDGSFKALEPKLEEFAWTSDTSVWQRSAFTNFSNSFKGAEAYSILAPGYNIVSANAYYNKFDVSSMRCDSVSQFCSLSGTSQSAPFVSGAAALIAEKYPFADGRLLADILLSTANSNITDIPKIIIKQSIEKMGTIAEPASKHYYYDVIYTEDANAENKTKEEVKNDLKTIAHLSEEQANEVVEHIMTKNIQSNIYVTYMSKDELIGQGILDITKALNGLAKVDANRLLDSDVKKSLSNPSVNQAFYTIDTKGQNGDFSNNIEQVRWKTEWHNANALNAPKNLNGLDVGFIKTGDGTLILSGANNTYSGDTIASGGTLKLTGILENSSVFAQNGGTFNLAGNVKNNVTAMNNGIVLLSNGATIGKNLNSQNDGIIEIENGANINAQTVNNAGILKGIGTIVGNVKNDGIVMSGFYNEIDDISGGEKLDIQGNFAQSSGGAKLQIAFLKNGANTDFSAQTYDIKGGILEYIPLQNSENYIKPNDEIKIAINQNLTNELGNFTQVQAKSTNLLDFEVDSTDKTLLNAKVKENAFNTGNTELSNVLKEMFGRNISPQYDAAFAAMGDMSPAQYQSTMDSIAATPTKQSLHTIDNTQKTLGLKNTLFMVDPFDNIGDLNPSSVVFKPTAALGDAHLQNVDDVYVKTKLSAGITYKKMKHDDYDQTSYLFDIQGKKEIDERSKLGGFIGLAHSKSENDDSKIKSNLFSLGASYEHDFGVLSALGGLSAGMSFNDLDQSIRNLAGSQTSAKYKNYFLTAQAGIYKGIALSENTQIAPLAMLEYNFIHQESFSQSGGVFARDFDAKNSNFARIWAGANLSHKWMLNDFEMTGSLYAFYWHRFSSKQSEDLSFSAARDLKFSNNFSAEQDGFYGGVSLQARRKNVFFKASFSDEKSSAYNQYEIMLRAGINF